MLTSFPLDRVTKHLVNTWKMLSALKFNMWAGVPGGAGAPILPLLPGNNPLPGEQVVWDVPDPLPSIIGSLCNKGTPIPLWSGQEALPSSPTCCWWSSAPPTSPTRVRRGQPVWSRRDVWNRAWVTISFVCYDWHVFRSCSWTIPTTWKWWVLALNKF